MLREFRKNKETFNLIIILQGNSESIKIQIAIRFLWRTKSINKISSDINRVK